MKLLTKSLALTLVVDGLSAMLAPRRYLPKLQSGTPLVDDLLEFGADHPQFTQAVAAVEVLAGAWLLTR